MINAALHAIALVFVIFTPRIIVCATPAPFPLTPEETVRSFLENEGGHELIRKKFNLHPDVVYNPFLHFARVEAAERLNHANYGRRTLSDVELLREHGYYLPGIDDAALLTSGRLLLPDEVPGARNTIINGTHSSYELRYRGNAPPEAEKAVQFALKIWADKFPCKAVRLRVLMNWKNYPGNRLLGSAIAPFQITRRRFDDSGLRPNTAYMPALAAAIGNKDYVVGNYHFELLFNEANPWHFSTNTPAGEEKYDLTTFALNLIGTSLFFSGALVVNSSKETATFQSFENMPGVFDQFVQMSNGIGIARSCNPSQLYRALTTPGLRFKTNNPENTFTLHAPVWRRSRSSRYFFDPDWLKLDCKRHNIDPSDCSDFMGYRRDSSGYTQHSIGVPTLRVMRTILGNSSGLGKSTCIIPPALKLPPEEVPSAEPGVRFSEPSSSAVLITVIVISCIVALIIIVTTILVLSRKRREKIIPSTRTSERE